MNQFLGYAFSGIPYGCTYALFAVGLVLTYQATGVFNFAFAAQAYTSAFIFMYLEQQLHLSTWVCFVIAVPVLAPLLGWLFDFFLFSRIPNTNVLAKVVTGISLLVGIPSLLAVGFGTENLVDAPSILFNANDYDYFHLFGISQIPIGGIFLSSVLATAFVLVALVILMRFTSVGLKMRASVESPRLVQLEGVNAKRIINFSWIVSSLLAGLAGVLLAPNYATLQSETYITLMVTAIAAAAWGVMRSMPVAAGVALFLAILESLAQGYLPSGSVLKADVLPVLPMIVLVAALLILPGMRSLEDAKDPLASVDPPAPPTAASTRSRTMDRIIRPLWWLVFAGFVVSMLTWVNPTWEGVFNQGLAFAVIFLSITLITGLGGQLSLAQAALAGIGAFTAGQLALHLHLNLLLGMFVGAILAAVVASILGALSLKLRGIGLALMTLAAALVFTLAVFPIHSVSSSQSGLTFLTLPSGFGLTDLDGHSFFILSLVVLVVIVLGILQIRKGTIGRYLGAMKGSEVAARGLGINPNRHRIMIFALSGAVAGIGGALFSIQQLSATTSDFNYQYCLVFVVVVITTGVSTVEGAIQAGIGLTVTIKLITMLPPRYGGTSLVFVLFAFGALTYASHPEGILEFQRRRWMGRFDRWVFHVGKQDPPRKSGSENKLAPNGGTSNA